MVRGSGPLELETLTARIQTSRTFGLKPFKNHQENMVTATGHHVSLRFVREIANKQGARFSEAGAQRSLGFCSMSHDSDSASRFHCACADCTCSKDTRVLLAVSSSCREHEDLAATNGQLKDAALTPGP